MPHGVEALLAFETVHLGGIAFRFCLGQSWLRRITFREPRNKRRRKNEPDQPRHTDEARIRPSKGTLQGARHRQIHPAYMGASLSKLPEGPTHYRALHHLPHDGSGGIR